MSRIQSSVGLITGIPIEETVKKLMDIAAQPRDRLKVRTDGLRQQQAALDQLGSRLLSFQFSLNKLKAGTVFQSREVTSSAPDVLEATLPATGTPNVGSFQVKPVRTASAQQLVSQRFDNAADALGSGKLSFRVGGHVDRGLALDLLNGGADVQRGNIKITDRSGESAVIDLSYARTVDDVIAAINSNDELAVTASTSGDSFVLTDNSGGAGNLRVQEVGSGKTAAGLGLAGVNDAASTATGADVLRLAAGTKLAALNDGNGVDVSKQGVVDLVATLRDGSELAIDLHDAITLGDVVEQINAVNDDKLTAAISADGQRLELTDHTGGSGPLSVASGVASTTAEDLGLVETVEGSNTLTGGRLIAGLRDSLLSRLNGGAGVGALAEITITDRDGVAANVDLSTAETLGDVVTLINAANVGVSATINAARNGIAIADDTDGAGNLTITSADATDSAEALNIDIDDAVAGVDSGTLGRQSLSRATLLSSLNGGKGVVFGDIRVTDAAGSAQRADLDSTGAKPTTVGDVIDAINALSNGVAARINDTGDGLLITDTTHGSSTLGIKDIGGDIAKTLKLTRASKTVTIDGAATQVIDGTTTYTVDLADLEVDETAVPLASLNNGSGVAAGDVVITNSRGKSIHIDFNGADSGIATVGQLIELINERAENAGPDFKVTAQVNDSGDGIELVDTAGGNEKLTVRDVNSSTAADLKLNKTAVTVGGKQVIEGNGAFTPATATSTGLDALAARINELEAGVTASKIFDGIGYRLSLTANSAGSASELLVDAADAGLTFEETAKAQDALLLFGDFANPGAGVLLRSPDGKFDAAVGGVAVQVKSVSETPVTINVEQTDAELVDVIDELVSSYNALRTDLGKLTAFNADEQSVGLLFGTNEALQIDSRLSQVLTGRFFGLGEFQSLETIGLGVTDDGMLEFNQTKLQAAFENNPEGLRTFLTDETNGVVGKLTAAIERLAGEEDSLLAARSTALQDSIKANDDRLEQFGLSLERQQERMELQFYQLESLIAKMQTSLQAIQNLQVIPPLTR